MKKLLSLLKPWVRGQAWSRYVGWSFALYDRYSADATKPKLCGFHLYLGWCAIFFTRPQTH